MTDTQAQTQDTRTAEEVRKEIEKQQAIYKEKVKAERQSAIDAVKAKIKTYNLHPSEVFSKQEILEQIKRYRVGVDVKPATTPAKTDEKAVKTANTATTPKEAPKT